MNDKENKLTEEDLQRIARYEAEEQRRARAIAIEAGCRTRDIANEPDGGRATLGKETWEKLQSYAAEREKFPRRY